MKRFSKGTVIQTIIFRKDQWSIAAAKKWLKAHKYKSPKPETTAEYHRFRQSSPVKFKAATFRTIELGKGKGIKAVIASPKEAKRNPEKWTDTPGTLIINKKALREKLEREYSPFLVAKYIDRYLKWFDDPAMGTTVKVVSSGPLLSVKSSKNNSASYLRSQFAASPFSAFLRIHTPYKDFSEPKRKNPAKTSRANQGPKTSRIPSLLADLATCRSLELEDGTEVKFPIAGDFAMCASPKGDELWILSRKGAKRVRAEDRDTEMLFEKFSGFEADDTGALIMLPNLVLKRIGRVKAIVYRSDKFSNKEHDYIHAFKQYPTVSVDNKNRPKIVAIRGGRIRVTAEGIIG